MDAAMRDQILAECLRTLPDEVFKTGNQEGLEELEFTLSDFSFSGHIIACRPQQSVDGRRTLPLLHAHLRDAGRDAAVAGSNSLLLAAPLGAGSVHVVPLFVELPDDKNRPAKPEQKPAKARPPGQSPPFYTAVSRVDAQANLKLPWRPGTWALTVVCHDWTSNTELVELVSKLGEDPDPERAALAQDPAVWLLDDALRVHRQVLADAQSVPPGPDFEQQPDSPEAPAGGAAFTLESWAADAETAPLRIAVRLPLPAGCLVEPRFADEGRESPIPLSELPTGLLPASLIITRKDRKNPPPQDFLIPLYGEFAAGQEVQACCNFDFIVHRVPQLLPGSYRCSLAVADQLVGPQELIVRAGEGI